MMCSMAAVYSSSSRIVCDRCLLVAADEGASGTAKVIVVVLDADAAAARRRGVEEGVASDLVVVVVVVVVVAGSCEVEVDDVLLMAREVCEREGERDTTTTTLTMVDGAGCLPRRATHWLWRVDQVSPRLWHESTDHGIRWYYNDGLRPLRRSQHSAECRKFELEWRIVFVAASRESAAVALSLGHGE